MFTDVAGGCVFGYARFGCKRGWRPVGFPDSTVRENRVRRARSHPQCGLEFPIERISEAGLIGGAGVPHPGEISLFLLGSSSGLTYLTPRASMLPSSHPTTILSRDSQIRTLPPVTGEWSQDLPTPVTSSR